jgi:hypothetical protein
MTAGRLILDMPNPALDADGSPYAGAKLFFYQAGTSTLQDVFTDATLNVPLSNPVVSDGAGRFVQIWADISKTYDVRWTDPNGALIYTFDGITSLGGGVAPNGDGAIPNQFRAALGLGTAALANTGDSGDTVPFLDGSNTWSGNQNFTAGAQINGNDVGYMGIPPTDQDADYTLALTDVGKRLTHTSASGHAWTIPPQTSVAWNNDSAPIVLRNIGTGVVTVTRGAGVTLRIAGNSSSANVALASYGLAFLERDAQDVWCIGGAGLS